MLTTPHLLAGAVVGVVLKDPLLVAPVAFAVHYVLDSVPHYAPSPPQGYKEHGLKAVSLDELLDKGIEPVFGIALTLGIVWVASPELKVPIIVGAVFGWLPDLLTFLEWKYDIKRPKAIKKLEDRFHKHAGGVKGILPQIIFSLLCLIFLFAKVN